MAEKNRSTGTGNKAAKGDTGSKTEGDRRPLGQGSTGGTWTDKFGRTCIGNDCFTLAIDEQRQELVVNVKPDNQCINPEIIESIRRTIGQGARTIYEVDSEIKKS